MALGIVLIKKAGVGVSPISVIPSVLSTIFPLSFGIMTIFFQLICFAMIFVVQRTADLKTVLIMPVAIVFGFIIDFYMYLLPIGEPPIVLRYVICLICLAGIAGTAMGIVIITGTDLMLPAGDALIRAISQTCHIPLSRVKVMGDAVYVVIALIIELSYFHYLDSVWIGTILSVLLTGFFVGRFGKWFPRLNMKQEEAPAS